MPIATNFYAWWDKDWAGKKTWRIFDRTTRKMASRKTFATERAALAHCERMQADYDRYQAALWERRASCLRRA